MLSEKEVVEKARELFKNLGGIKSNDARIVKALIRVIEEKNEALELVKAELPDNLYHSKDWKFDNKQERNIIYRVFTGHTLSFSDFSDKKARASRDFSDKNLAKEYQKTEGGDILQIDEESGKERWLPRLRKVKN